MSKKNDRPRTTDTNEAGFDHAFADIFGDLSGAQFYRAALELTGRGVDALSVMKRHRAHQAALAGDVLEFASQLQTPYELGAEPFFGSAKGYQQIARELEAILAKA